MKSFAYTLQIIFQIKSKCRVYLCTLFKNGSKAEILKMRLGSKKCSTFFLEVIVERHVDRFLNRVESVLAHAVFETFVFLNSRPAN